MDYEKAKERIKSRFDKWALDDEDLEAMKVLIPELKESEDEGIRKALIQFLRDYPNLPNGKYSRSDFFDWLERQKENPDRLILIGKAKSEKQVVLLAESNGDENIYWDTKSEDDAVSLLEKGLKFFGKQKQAEWSEEDEDMRKKAVEYITLYSDEYGDYNEIIRVLSWLKSLRSQPKNPVLSEKMVICLKRTLDFLRKEHNAYTGEDFTNEIPVLEWLITHPTMVLSYEPHWKPSEEQMKAFSQIVRQFKPDKELESLYNDLKKLI